MDDHALLRQFADSRSDDAFAALVERHVDLAYSVALHAVGNPHDAEEITQAVFILFAQKAPRLHGNALAGWFFRTARWTARNFQRSEYHRRQREQEAAMQSILDNEISEISRENWSQIAPLLDEAVARLRERDRQAILLRFYEGRSLREVGLALGASEFAASKRITRALEKLRGFLTQQGIASTSATLSSAMTLHSVQAAPAGLAKTISAVALTKGAAVSTSTLTLIKGTLKIMAWTKAKTAIVIGAAALLATGTTTVVVHQVQAHRTYPWQTMESLRSPYLEKAPPMQKIVPTRFPVGGGSSVLYTRPTRWIGLGQTVDDIFSSLYGISQARIVFLTPKPAEKFDWISTSGQELMAAEIRKRLGLKGTLQTMDTNVLFLMVKNPNITGLKPGTTNQISSSNGGPNGLTCTNTILTTLSQILEMRLGIPVMDKTGLTNCYDFTLTWADNIQSKTPQSKQGILNQALSDQIGLELVPTNMPIEMLVIDKAK